jgi:thiol-disulfide isomerase/thioredoxin
MKVVIGLWIFVLLSGVVPATDLPLLEGELSRGEILAQLTPYQERFDAYQPDEAVIKEFPPLPDSLEIFAVFGSWCDDSLEQVPKFMKILDRLGVPGEKVHWIAVNRSKQDPEGLTAGMAVERVPTFIVFRSGREIGRIVESPKKSLERDLKQILATP